MQELFQLATHPVHIVFTILLTVVLIYWVGIILGALDINAFDFDVDTDVDVEVDVDVDVDTDLDTDTEVSGGGWIVGALHFFNFGKVPFMVIMSFVILLSWTISILVDYHFGMQSYAFALAMLFPNLFVSLLITKLITSPLVPVFQKFDKGIEPVDYVGRTCTLILPPIGGKMGQAQVMEDESPLLVNVKLDELTDQVRKGDEAVIVSVGDEKKFYYIRKSDELK